MQREQFKSRAVPFAQQCEEVNYCLRMGAATIIHNRIAQRIVGRDRLVCHAEQVEHASDDDSSSIATGDAVDEGWLRVAFAKRPHDFNEHACSITKHLHVACRGRTGAVVVRVDPTGVCDLEEWAMQVSASWQSQPSPELLQFDARAEIDDCPKPDCTGKSSRYWQIKLSRITTAV